MLPLTIYRETEMKNNVKELRLKRGLTQTALADIAGTSKRTIYAIETENQDIHISLAHNLATSLNCSIDDLFDFDDNTPATAKIALWFVHVVRYLSEELEVSVREATKLLERSGLVQKIISGYPVWHTQGYEYMAEMLADELNSMTGEQSV